MAASGTTRVAGLSRVVLFVIGALLIAAACALGAVIFALSAPFAIDTWWNSVLVESASPLLMGFSRVLDQLGGGWFGILVFPILGTAALIVIKRPWSAAFFITAQAASAGAVQVLKHVFGRARPEEIIVLSDYGSFPSGHVAGAATIAAAAYVLFPRVWVAIVGIAWVLFMAIGRTALHAHWLSDTIGGALIGVGVVLVVAGIFAPALRRENPDAARSAPSLG